MSKNEKTRTWAVTLLTPLHIGDGESLHENLDYVVQNKRLRVYEIDDILMALKDNPSAVSDMGREAFDLQKFMKTYRIDVPPRYELPCQGTSPKKDLRRFLKDAHGRPYLPGSSLKGALRTALWQGLDRRALPPVSDFKNFTSSVKNLCDQPHKDFLRPLSISDSPGLSPGDALVSQEVKFFNIRTGGHGGWKSFEGKGNPTKDRFEDAAGIHVEALKPGTCLYVRGTLDGFLKDPAISRLWSIPSCEGVEDVAHMVQRVNQHYENHARTEWEFFSRFTETGEVRDFYQHLLNGFGSLGKNQDQMIVRLAWGSGWRGMTGDWISHGDLSIVRKESNLGRNTCPSCGGRIFSQPKRGEYFCKKCESRFPTNQLSLFDIFPKTRRLAIKDAIPQLPFGWVLLSPAAAEKFSESVWLPALESIGKSSTEQAVPVGKTESIAPAASPEVPSPKPVRETWSNVMIAYTPGSQEAKVSAGNKTATLKGKAAIEALLPPPLFSTLMAKRKITNVGIDVELIGGTSYKIVGIR